MPPSALTRLRKICLSFPEAREVMAWGEPTFRVKTIFAMHASAGNHHGAGHDSVWVKAVQTNQELLIRADPDRFFSPPYVGPSGWIGVRLDARSTDWDELRELLWDAWCMSAPAKLVAKHPDMPTGTAPRANRTTKATKRRATRAKGKPTRKPKARRRPK